MSDTAHSHHESYNFRAAPIPVPEIFNAVFEPIGRSGWKSNLVIILSVIAILWGAYKFLEQLTWGGMGVTGLHLPNYWGFYIITFVFWIGVAHAGALISALLRLCGAEWKSAVTRVAEVITLFTLPAAASFPLIHLGRTELFYYMLPVPNNRLLWPNFKSPLMWDVFAISTYLTGSVLFLYVTLVPDLGIARPRMKGWIRTLYTLASWGWRGTSEEWMRVKEAAALYSVVILPVVISVHTIVSWDFAMQVVPGWHSEVFGPLFFVGALYSGTAAVFTMLSLLVWTYPSFKKLITQVHYDMLGRVWLVLGMAWAYLFFNDFLPAYYAHEPDKMDYLYYNGFGPYAWTTWFLFVGNFALPLFCLAFKEFRRSIAPMFVLSIIVNICMYIERVFIIIPGLEVYNHLNYNTLPYYGSFTEISIVVATFGWVIGGLTMFCRLFPILPYWELAETKTRELEVEVAGVRVNYFQSGE
ncbi:MAG: polysulfide reductase NrfD [Armatimonadetes bacterium]|nr:polysulfide reductase NrfD [Armatimonadota bacterium]